MLNLFDYLTPEDNTIIKNYISTFGVEEGYVGNEEYLKYWAKCNKKLFHLLGGNLIYKVPYVYKKPEGELTREIQALTDTPFSGWYEDFILKIVREEKEANPEIDKYTLYDSLQVLSFNQLNKDSIRNTLKRKFKGCEKTLQLQQGMKPIRAAQKILKYFNVDDEHMKMFEEFRIVHSMILNEKEVKGTLCLSIHPMDFMTMSDNDSDWSSCMSWRNEGCYHIGTVEMMNSNNVICAYLQGSTPFNFDKKNHNNDPMYQWNNKKWRQLFYCTKEIIVNGKGYPYNNDQFSQDILNILRELAIKNWHRTYEFGIEPYYDMKHISTLSAMENNRIWIRSKYTKKQNIIFDSNGMYNDMLNDSRTHYFCIRNRVKKNTIINYSGKAPCICCMNRVIEEKYDCDYDDGTDEYNGRYEGVESLLCSECKDDRYCDLCGNESGYYSTVKIGRTNVCSRCYKEECYVCPDCGKAFILQRGKEEVSYTRFVDKKFYMQDIVIRHYAEDLKDCTENLVPYYVCEECKHNDDKFMDMFLERDPSRENWMFWTKGWSVRVRKEITPSLKDEDFLKHLPGGMKRPD